MSVVAFELASVFDFEAELALVLAVAIVIASEGMSIVLRLSLASYQTVVSLSQLHWHPQSSL